MLNDSRLSSNIESSLVEIVNELSLLLGLNLAYVGEA